MPDGEMQGEVGVGVSTPEPRAIPKTLNITEIDNGFYLTTRHRLGVRERSFAAHSLEEAQGIIAEYFRKE